MKQEIRFPIKGTYYYSAGLAIELSLLPPLQTLNFELEPENYYDANAIQIFLPKLLQSHSTTDNNSSAILQQTTDNGLLLGYVPRLLAKRLNKQIQQQLVSRPQVCHCTKVGNLIEIDCRIEVDQALPNGLPGLVQARINYIQLFLLALFTSKIHNIKRWQRRFFTRHKRY